jgi:hypothetical protein
MYKGINVPSLTVNAAYKTFNLCEICGICFSAKCFFKKIKKWTGELEALFCDKLIFGWNGDKNTHFINAAASFLTSDSINQIAIPRSRDFFQIYLESIFTMGRDGSKKDKTFVAEIFLNSMASGSNEVKEALVVAGAIEYRCTWQTWRNQVLLRGHLLLKHWNLWLLEISSSNRPSWTLTRTLLHTNKQNVLNFSCPIYIWKSLGWEKHSRVLLSSICFNHVML